MASESGDFSWEIQYRQPSPAPRAYAGESFDGVSDSDSEDGNSPDTFKSTSCGSGVGYATGRVAASSSSSVPPSTSFFCRQGVNGNAGLARRSSPDIATHRAEAPLGSDGALLDDEAEHDDHFHYPTHAVDTVMSPIPSKRAPRFIGTADGPKPLDVRAPSSRFQPSPPLNEQHLSTQATSATQKGDKLPGLSSFPARVFQSPQSVSSSVVALQTLSPNTSNPQQTTRSPLDVHRNSHRPWERHHIHPIMPSPRFDSVKAPLPQSAVTENKKDDEEGGPKPLPPDVDVPPMLHLLQGLRPAFANSKQGAGALTESPAAAMPSAPTGDEVVQGTSQVPCSQPVDSALQESMADQPVNHFVPETEITRIPGRTSQKSRAAITLTEYLESSGKTRHTCDRCGTILTPEAIAFIKASDAAAAARDRKVAFKPPSRSSIKQEPSETTEDNAKSTYPSPASAKPNAASDQVDASQRELVMPSVNESTARDGFSSSLHMRSAAVIHSSETPDATWHGLEKLADLTSLAAPVETSSPAGPQESTTADMPMTRTEEISYVTMQGQGRTKLDHESDETFSLAGETLSLPEPGSSPVLSDVTVKHGIEILERAANADLLTNEGEAPVSPKTVTVGGWTVSRTTTPSSATSTPSTSAFSPGPLFSPISSVSSQEGSPIAPADEKPYKVSGWTITPKNAVSTAFVQQPVLAPPQYIHPDRALMLIDVEPQPATLPLPQKASEPKGLGIGWGDDEPSTPIKAPNLAWDPEVAIKKLPSPTNPTGVRGMGRSPSNSAAPAERVLAPPLNEWRDSFEHVRSPADRPSSRMTANQSIQSSRIERERTDAIPSASLNALSASVHDNHALVSTDLVQSQHTDSKENSGRESPYKARNQNGSPVFKRFASSTYGDFRGSKASQWANHQSRATSAEAHVLSTHGHGSGWEQPAPASNQGGEPAVQDVPRDGWGQIIEKVKESASFGNSNSPTTSAISSPRMSTARSPQNSVLSSRSKTPTSSSAWKTAKATSQDCNTQRVSSPMPFIPKSYQGWQKPRTASQAGVHPNLEGSEASAGWSMPAPTFQAPTRTFISPTANPSANSTATIEKGWIA